MNLHINLVQCNQKEYIYLVPKDGKEKRVFIRKKNNGFHNKLILQPFLFCTCFDPIISGVQVAVYHQAQKPGNYVNFSTHVEKVKQEREIQKAKENKKKGPQYGECSKNIYI